MIELNMHTMWIWLVISEVLFALLLGMVWNLRRSEPSLIYWAAASLSLALGALGISQRGHLPDWLSIAVANILIGLAWSLRWAGLRCFASQSLRPVFYVAGPVLVGLLFQFRDLLNLEVWDRVAISAVMGAGYALMMAADSLRARRDERLFMRNVLIAISILAAVYEMARGFNNWQGGGNHFLAQNLEHATFLLGFLSLFALFDLTSFMMVFERHENRLVRDATVDSLTNVLNRAGFSELADRQVQRSRRDRKLVSVLVMDLDFFKRVNDTYGHEAGDAVLRAFAQAARAVLRPTDLLGRPGGEEFWALLPNSDLAEACRAAQRICDRFRETRVSFGEHSIAATASIGAAELDRANESLQTALSRADQALYAAKHAGRDRVVAAPAAAPVAA